MGNRSERGVLLKSLPWLLCLYALVLVLITVLNRIGADRYWFSALNLYLPQIVWAVPGLVLVVVVYQNQRAWLWFPLLCLLWVFGPIMGFSWGSRGGDTTGVRTLRLMTWNIKYGYYQLAPLLEELARCNPDVVFLQDAVGSLQGPLRQHFQNWHVRVSGQYVIASKYPLSKAEVLELPYFGDQPESLLRCQMYLGPAAVSLYNVHLKTPRRSLNAFRSVRSSPWYLPEAIGRLEHNVTTRWLQALAVLGYLGGQAGPVIVAGDLNSTDGSMVLGELRNAGLHDAFAERGSGYGYTYGHLLFKYRLPWLRLSWMRIDHIMLSSAFQTTRCWAGTGEASDHRPVIADLVLKNP